MLCVFFWFFFILLDASKAKEKIIYFIKKSNGEIVTMPTDEAAVVYPRQVLEYLAHSIDKN